MKERTTIGRIFKMNFKLPKWAKSLLKVMAALLLLITLAYMGLAFYVNTHKEEILISIKAKINKNLKGKFEVESMDPTFLQGFPRISLRLKNVALKDSLWKQHQKTLLKAADFNISINPFAFLTGTLDIKKITISNAQIYLFTDENGYTNASVFKSGPKKETTDSEGSFAEIKSFELEDVVFTSENLKGKKLFEFLINDLKGNIDYDATGWNASAGLNAFANSLAFNTRHGSFIASQKLKGNFDIAYNETANTIIFKPNNLKIGESDFNISGKFNLGQNNSLFSITIEAKKIFWKKASELLSKNISRQLNRFDLEQPIAVICNIKGDLNANGDPLIFVEAKITDNRLHIPNGFVDNCSFTGIFTNEFIKGNGFNDPNSAVKLINFKGTYKEMPFTMESAIINNFKKPIATGKFQANFPLEKLNNVIDKNLLVFNGGTANLELQFKAPVVDLEITKPFVSGLVKIENGTIHYAPRNLVFKNTDIALDFTEKDLFIKNIRLQTGKSIVFMDGNIQNFLNLYYTEPEKIVLQWNVKSPEFHLSEFLGFLGSRKIRKITKKNKKESDVTKNLDFLFEKSNVAMNVNVEKLFYNKFSATNMKAQVLLSETGMSVKNATINHAGGSLKFNGLLTHGENYNQFGMNVNIQNVNIEKFFYAFNNFEMQTLSSKNLKGYLSSKASIKGSFGNNGKLVTNSINGNVNFNLKQGALVNFEPVKNVGKFAFPFRDLNHITFSNLNGKFEVVGEKIKIYPMKINSSVLNMDVAGIYSFGKGTNIALDVPLRNPQNDKNITDEQLLEERRNRGIVIHLLASDDENGKVKIRLVSKKTSENAVEK
ncbi:MAG TPA: AsmA family protein [Flavobacterium sp.]|jgi:hypothetical protein